MAVEANKELSSIKQIAYSLLKGANLLDVFPLPVEKIAEHLGYTVKNFIPSRSETQNVSGAVSKAKRKILINNKDPYLRQRFTLAHEIGHIMLHFDASEEEFVDYRRSDKIRDEKETEADEFAACLLMPEDKFIECWKKYEGNFALMSSFFGVSRPSIGMRAYNLGLE